MSGSTQFEIKLSEKFQRTLERIVKKCCQSKAERQKLKKYLVELWDKLATADPELKSVRCPWIKKIPQPEYVELRKLKFKVPNRKGASGEGRILYLLDHKNLQVIMLWIYTHEEYKVQPPPKDLKEAIVNWAMIRAEEQQYHADPQKHS